MCDPELIAAILKDLGQFDEKKEKDKKDEVDDEGRQIVKKKRGRRSTITHLFTPDPGDLHNSVRCASSTACLLWS
jgi:hypothetical protein